MPIAFPDVTATLRAAGVTPGLTPERLLLVGSQLGGTALTGALTTNILNDGSEDALYGVDSPLAGAIRRARRRNPETQFDAIGLDDDGSADKAAADIVITGPATEDGEIIFYVGSKKFNEYKIAVTDTDTATIIGDALAAAITADSGSWVVAVNTAGSVAITAKTGGTFGNTIGSKAVGTVGGVAVAITAMSAGATDPVLTGVFDVVGNQRYQGIAWQFDQELDEVIDFLADRFNVSNDVLDGRAFTGMTDTFANHLSTLGALNSRDLCINTDNLIAESDHQGPAVLEIPFIKVSEFAGTRALKRTDEAVLGDLVIARSARDGFGGPWQNSKPYANTPFPDLKVPDVGDSFSDVEIGQLTDAGGWVIDANRVYNSVISGEVVTTYKTDPAGNPDPTFTFLNYVDTETAYREYLVNTTRAQYPQYRATGGALINGVDSANEASIAAFVAEKNQEAADFALVNSGVGTVDGVAVDYDKLFRENLVVTLNPVTGKFFVALKMFPVVQLRGVTYDIAVAFEV